MFRGFEQADFDKLAHHWQSFYPQKYWVNAELIKQQTVESPVFDWGASQIYDGGKEYGFAIVKKSASPLLYKGNDPDISHLSAIAFTGPQIGIDLLASVKRVLRARGCYKLVFGQDSRHFFPGCPKDCNSLRDFLTVEGFLPGQEVFDLERDISDYVPKAGSAEKLTGDTRVEPITHKTFKAFSEMIEREFPGRWTYDVREKIVLENKTDFVYGLFVGDQIEGFAFTQDYTHRYPINGCVWHLALGDRWGGLGPIGVAASSRGKGLGDALLAGALLGLKERGVHNMNIDWTSLDRYYGGHGFDITRQYNSFELKLETQ
jgi:GNAT superfamily N-acetyltransferase